MSDRTLAELVSGAPLVVCLGPGGVGKTTLAAVLALHQAAVGERALVLTIDPARRLADALGVAGLTNDPASVTSFANIHPVGSLSALMLDPAATFDHLIGLLVSDPARREAMLQNRFYQHMSRSLSGTLEYMAVERLHHLVSTKEFDSIVLDTPPTSNALDFLEAPARLGSFFSERVTRWFLPGDKAKPAGIASRFIGRAGSSAVGLLKRIAGDVFVEDTMGFFGAFADLLGSFGARGVEIGRLLKDPRTVFLIICAPDASRLGEAQAIDRRLAESGCRAHAFIVNRVDEPFLPEAGELKAAIDHATAILGGEPERERVESFMRRLEAMRVKHASNALDQLRIVDRLRRHATPRPVFMAPRVPPGESPRAALLALYVGLFADSGSSPAPERARADGPALGSVVVRYSDA
jgi:anion-transporting  ArsA/GET3 family ATPase